MFMYKYLQDVLTTLCFTCQLRDLFSAHTPLVRNPLYTPVQCNALPYIGKFGIYGLAAPCRHNTNQP